MRLSRTKQVGIHYALHAENPIMRIKSAAQVIAIKATVMLLAIILATSALFVIKLSSANAYSGPLVLGELSYQKLLAHPLSDKNNLLVNVVNGNLILQTEELNIAGVGTPLAITRYYNNLSSVNGQYGARTTSSIGADIKLTSNSDGSVTYQGPSGFTVTYNSNGSGGYVTPSSYTNANLSLVSGGWKLTFTSGEVYNFNSNGQFTSDTNPNGQSITYAYNANGTLATATDTQGKVTTFTSAQGSTNLRYITDPSGRRTAYDYTGNKLDDYVDAGGNEWIYTYDASGNLQTIEDGEGIQTAMTYDTSNRITSIQYDTASSTDTTTWTYTYNSGNTVVTDPLNHQTTYNYDMSGRVTNVVDADGNSRGASWDANNNVTSVTDPSNQVTTLAYDGLNNLLSVTSPSLSNGSAGAKTTYGYGNSAHPYSAANKTDAQGNQVAYSYDTSGNAQSATNSSSSGTGMGAIAETIQGDPDGQGGTTNCGAKSGEVCTSIDANGNTTSYGYDSAGNVTSVVSPGPVGHTTITYDSLSRPATVTDGNGNTSTITYYGSDLPKEVKTPTTDTQYTYDGNDNLARVTSTGGSQAFEYDDYNRLEYIQAGTTAIDYTYDAVGNIKTEEDDNTDVTTTYSYDNADNVTTVANSKSGQSETFSYTNGRPTGVTLPGGITETIGYDQAGRETSVVAKKGTTTILSQSGTYTNASGKDTELLQTLTDNVSGKTTTYSYDGLNRLTGASQSGTGSNSYTYSYDNAGNMTASTHNGAANPSFGYNAANELTTVNGASAGSYDQNGNQTATRANLALGYNAANQTTSFTPNGGSAIAVTYADSDQNARSKMGTTCQTTGALGIYSDKANCSSPVTYYQHLPSGSGQTLSEITGNNAYYYITDLHGSVAAVSDKNGAVVNTYSYDPYGNTIASTGTVANPWRYNDGYFDASTGLYKFGERYYNPADARWTQLDPSGEDPGYVFVADNPVNSVDPTGTFPQLKNIPKYLEKYAERIKQDIVGKRHGGRYDVKYDPKDGKRLYLEQKQGGQQIETDYFTDDPFEELFLE